MIKERTGVVLFFSDLGNQRILEESERGCLFVVKSWIL